MMALMRSATVAAAMSSGRLLAGLYVIGGLKPRMLATDWLTRDATRFVTGRGVRLLTAIGRQVRMAWSNFTHWTPRK